MGDFRAELREDHVIRHTLPPNAPPTRGTARRRIPSQSSPDFASWPFPPLDAVGAGQGGRVNWPHDHPPRCAGILPPHFLVSSSAFSCKGVCMLPTEPHGTLQSPRDRRRTTRWSLSIPAERTEPRQQPRSPRSDVGSCPSLTLSVRGHAYAQVRCREEGWDPRCWTVAARGRQRHGKHRDQMESVPQIYRRDQKWTRARARKRSTRLVLCFFGTATHSRVTINTHKLEAARGHAPFERYMGAVARRKPNVGPTCSRARCETPPRNRIVALTTSKLFKKDEYILRADADLHLVDGARA